MRRVPAIGLLVLAIALGVAWWSTTEPTKVRTVARAHQPRIAPRPSLRAGRPSSAVASAVSDEPSSRFANDLARIHAELGYWEAHVTGKVEDKELEVELGRRLRDLESLLTDENCAQIVDSLSAHELQSPFGIAALRRWLAIAPVEAARSLATRADTSDDLAFLVAEKMIERPVDLLELWRQSPDSTWVQKVLQHAAGVALVFDPRAAVELSTHLAPSESRTALLGQIAAHWAKSEPEAAIAWAQSVSDPQARDSVIVAAATGFASSDPMRAVDWLAANVSDPSLRKTGVETTIAAWGAIDFDSASRWVAALTDPDLRAIAAPVIANLQSQRNL